MNSQLSAIVAIILLLLSCSKDNSSTSSANLPVLTTDNVGLLTLNSAQSSTTITSDGGSTITAKGIVWSTDSNPTIELSTRSDDGIGIEAYTSTMTGLAVDLNYYVRSYATNSIGTAYSAQKQFVTSSEFIKDVTIGNQIWMHKNLDVTTYRNGDPIPQASSASEWLGTKSGAWCYHNEDSTNGPIYGKLYNWYAVNDQRGLAPSGYRIPSVDDWTILGSFLGGESQAGTKMKSVSLWATPNGTNSSGFTGLPGGARNSNGNFGNIINEGNFWCSNEKSSSDAFIRMLGTNSSSLRLFEYRKNWGFSVRCIKD